ncbi:hypothetical protein QFZ83_003696 [Variovorax sp. W1I1]|uniref:hypothetical protein n=1 Tax=Variovorax sp. W1I1 TaxID=3042309 RepID=UPI0027837390|nr:hypothetical protein [Variovorax sp. W1I1]MDQ0609525.1 hypothetical protein [Variovorax sp. W1I1]
MHSESHIDADRAPNEEQPRMRVPRQWRRLFETVGVVGSLFLGGFGSGYFWATRNAEVQMTRQREDHLAEIDRLREAFGDRLTSLAGRVNQAAGTAASAAQTAGEAASTAQTAAQTANQAAKTAAKEFKKP